jgi:PAS domain S-box-containing protein
MQIPIIKSAKKLIYNGKPYFLETFIDIKERKIAENELKKDAKEYLFDQSALKEFECKLYEERQRLANVIEGANIGTWELNVQTGETIVNERWAEILGYTLADISPVAIKRWSLLLHPEDLPRMNEALDSHLSGKTSIYDIEYRMMHKDGRWIWMHARGKLLAKTVDGKPLYMNGTHTDITVRKQYEKAIQENNDFLEDVFHSIQDGVFVLNEDFTIRHQNNIMKSWYHDCGSFSGKKCHVLFHNSDTPCDGCPTIRCFESKKTETAILTGRKNSNTKWVEAYSYPLKNRESGEITGAIVLIRDITKRKCDEEHLRKTNLLLEKQTALANSMADQARKASEAKSEFLANMSHEIRTPMNGLIGMTSLLFETPLNEEQFKYLEIIRSCGNSLLTLINDILDFSKIEAGRLEIESIDFDLCVLIKNFTEMISQRVHEKKLEFILDLSPDIPCLLNGDPHRFQQVLTNLVGNALKFTQEGEIIVKGEIVKDSENEAILKFSIQDSGIGIPAEKQKILFNKFTQVDNSPTRRYGGTGLGLAISKQLVTLMGGEIGIISPIIDQGSHHSESPHGSEFWFTSTFKKQSIQKTCLPKSIHFDNFSVLVIDENQAFRHNLKKILNSWNITVTETSSIYDAVFLMQKSLTDQVNYDIIFINQTASSSLSVSQIQQHFKTSYPNFKSNIVLVASSLHDLDTSGFSAVLQKPVFPDVLFSHVNQFVNHITGTPHEIHQRHSTGDIPFKNARILLVEDNIVNQKVAVGIMNKWNLSVDTAMNGLEALNALSRKKYDLVFMDVQMPELDGFETTKKIRDGENNVLDQTVPVIAMTAHTMCGDKEECISAGMNDYIPKPFNVDQLFAVLNKWLCSNSKGDSSSINNKK